MAKLRFLSKLCKSNWNCAWNLAFLVFISPIVWNMCENLHYKLVYLIELHNEQEYYWPTIYRVVAAVVSTITSKYIVVWFVVSQYTLKLVLCVFFTSQVGSWKPVSGKNENAVSSWQSKEPKWLGAFEEMVKCHNPGMIGSSTVPMRTLTVTTVLVSGVIFFSVWLNT